MESSYIRSPSDEAGSGVRRSADVDIDTPEGKRRKIRKGTRSCWECKRRKIRCNFGSAADAVCIGCQRRGTHCLSQAHPEEASRPAERGQQIGDRIVRVEALVEQLVRKVGNPSPPESRSSPINTTYTSSSKATPAERDDAPTTSYPGLPTPCPSDVESAFRTLCTEAPGDQHFPTRDGLTPRVATETDGFVPRPSGPTLPPNLQKFSKELYAALPSAKVTRHICESVGGFAIFFHQMMTRSKPDFDVEMATVEETSRLPPPDSHPIIIAKYMLNIAEYLQYMPHDQALIEALGEHPQAMMQRLAAAAITVTTNEDLMGTLESLECIILEGAFQANSGNLRRAWLAFRRAMIVAQLMGIHRARIPNVKKLDPASKSDPKFMWYRIQFADRFLGLMLGLPAGSHDNSFASEAALAYQRPMHRLERQMAVISARILDRNESAPENCGLAETQAIDLELQRVAKMMPSRWWLPPNLTQQARTSDQEAIFWETFRLTNQIFYYNLLNQLHLPYMLMFSSEKHAVYSKLACVNASREVLSRFIAFRTWNQIAFCCRSVDFFALMAAMTLVLAHLHASDEPDLNTLAHQRHSDRAMMEQVLESMENVYKLNMDVLSEKSGNLLRRLLEIEADAAEGRRYDTQSVMNLAGSMDGAAHGEVGLGAEGGKGQSDESGALRDVTASDDEPGVLRMCIPYFGVIRIAREGGISREPPAVPFRSEPQHVLGVLGVGDSSTMSNNNLAGQASDVHCNSDYCPVEHQGLLVVNARKYGGQHHDHPQQQQRPEGAHSQQQNGLHDHPNPEVGSNTGGYNNPEFVDHTLLQQYPFPGLAASADDWAFQGVDMAFFDNLMKGLDQNQNFNSGSVQQQSLVQEQPQPPVPVDSGGLAWSWRNSTV